MLVAALGFVALLQRGGALDPGDADAVVVLELEDDVDIDTVRQEIAQHGAPAWQARQVGEVSVSDEEVTLTLALPGSNLASAVAWLRNPTNTGAADETVDYSVDPQQLDLTPLSSGEGEAAPEPVLLEVRIVAAGDPGGGAMAVGALLLVIVAGAGLALTWRWYRNEHQDA